jgi:L-fucose mutarotase/ribose pyranase (RbsD/FucU family)
MNSDWSVSGDWKTALNKLLSLWGHRNWVVVADAAYPAQSNPGFETIATGADHLHLLNAVFGAIESSKHVRPKIYLDRELQHVFDQDAPGATEYREALKLLLGGRQTESLEHEQIIVRLDECAKLFRVLVLKSTLTIPYTSVFLELDCGYWNSDAEQRLRRSMREFENNERHNK